MDNQVKQVTERLPEHEIAAKLGQDFDASEQCEEELRRVRAMLLDRAHWIENVLDAHSARKRGEQREASVPMMGVPATGVATGAGMRRAY